MNAASLSNDQSLSALLDRALQARAGLFAAPYETAFRLFNGFLEARPDLAVDVYARTLVLYNYAEDITAGGALASTALSLLLDRLPWIDSALIKTRHSTLEQERRGVLVYGAAPARKVREHNVWYALDLTMNMDSSLYLDTRELRRWANDRLAGKRVLNTFAYTGSLGVAAAAGGAREVIQVDRSRRFLNLAKDSYALNGFPVRRAEFLTGDFWTQMNQFKRAGQLFDCIFVDPPFFSVTSRGKVDLAGESQRVINKVRPLVGHYGWLVAINNALFLSGADYMNTLQELCAGGYMSIEEIIPVSPDFAGFPETRSGSPPVDPAPFNHSTKIAVLRVTRKDQRAA